MYPFEVIDPVLAVEFNAAWLLILIPLVTAAILLVTGKFSNRWGHWLGTASILATFAVGLWLFIEMMMRPEAERAWAIAGYELFGVGHVGLNVGLLVDQLSILFVLLVTCLLYTSPSPRDS